MAPRKPSPVLGAAVLFGCLSSNPTAWAFGPVGGLVVGGKGQQRTRPGGPAPRLRLAAKKEGGGDIDLRSELAAYLKVRSERNADEEAKNQVGKTLGGTRGNKVLDFVSGAGSQARTIDEAPNVFDYDELMKYGFGNLVSPIMDAGGRSAMYKLMDMPPPPPPERLKPKSAPRLEIDREGKSDQARYTGLKMGQVLDDEEMGRALQAAVDKKRRGERLRPKLVEEDYVQPFADKRNTGPRQVPEWTAERIDDQTRKTGEALAWARKAKEGQYANDPEEVLSIEGGMQAYCMAAALYLALSFGRATPSALSLFGYSDGAARGLIDTLQGPAFGVLLASIGSAAASAVLLAPGKNRNAIVWGIKGFMGGPLAVFKLQTLDPLITVAETEDLAKEKKTA